jgi:hypothetical protein
MKYLIVLLLFFSSCTIWRTESTTDSTKKINEITKTTEIRQEAIDGQILELKTTTYSERTSKEIARAEQNSSHSSPAIQQGITGMGGTLDMVLAAVGGLGVLKTKQVIEAKWQANRDAPPPPKPHQEQLRAYKKEEEDAS